MPRVLPKSGRKGVARSVERSRYILETFPIVKRKGEEMHSSSCTKIMDPRYLRRPPDYHRHRQALPAPPRPASRRSSRRVAGEVMMLKWEALTPPPLKLAMKSSNRHAKGESR